MSKQSIPPSVIFKQGICGRKSFPTKKHINTKSSMILSKSYYPFNEVCKSLVSKYKNSLTILSCNI